MIPDKILNLVFEMLTEDQLLQVVQNFNDCGALEGTGDSRGVHKMITTKTYKKKVRGFEGVVIPTLQAVKSRTFYFPAQDGQSYDRQLEKKGLERTGSSSFTPCGLDKLTELGVKNPKPGRFFYKKEVEVTDNDLKTLIFNQVMSEAGVKTKKALPENVTTTYNGIVYRIAGKESSRKIMTKNIFGRIDQIYIQYYDTLEGVHKGHKVENIYFLNGKQISEEDKDLINWSYYDTYTAPSNPDTVQNYRMQSITNFKAVLPVGSK